ncbi:hypothetical protein QBC35DRAFT_476026 [Podospora australis]|uniref:Uncharacterized protein n=1 Tax=Podospora australis TaxID=1536484 RepID=A0AAN7AHB6_9PEZI|nr:hypothetical protein QBC35DRAFT_476026 [Podospora australis]
MVTHHLNKSFSTSSRAQTTLQNHNFCDKQDVSSPEVKSGSSCTQQSSVTQENPESDQHISQIARLEKELSELRQKVEEKDRLIDKLRVDPESQRKIAGLMEIIHDWDRKNRLQRHTIRTLNTTVRNQKLKILALGSLLATVSDDPALRQQVAAIEAALPFEYSHPIFHPTVFALEIATSLNMAIPAHLASYQTMISAIGKRSVYGPQSDLAQERPTNDMLMPSNACLQEKVSRFELILGEKDSLIAELKADAQCKIEGLMDIARDQERKITRQKNGLRTLNNTIRNHMTIIIAVTNQLATVTNDHAVRD